MLKFEHTETTGWETAFRGMRNPMNSWGNSDSSIVYGDYSCDIFGNKKRHKNSGERVSIGPNDKKLIRKLCYAGTDHRKFMRMITVYTDITGPLYWWKEFDTYKVGTVANSCSTMHKITEKEFTVNDFSHEHLTDEMMEWLNEQIDILNGWRLAYINAKDVVEAKQHWWQIIQMLPSSYNQKRTVMMNYEVLANICNARKGHKLDEWSKDFVEWIKTLPYPNMITFWSSDR